MVLDLKLPQIFESTLVKFKLPKDIADEFFLYVEAAKEQSSDIDESLVIETILRHHLAKDKGFKNWLKERPLATDQETSLKTEVDLST